MDPAVLLRQKFRARSKRHGCIAASAVLAAALSCSSTRINRTVALGTRDAGTNDAFDATGGGDAPPPLFADSSAPAPDEDTSDAEARVDADAALGEAEAGRVPLCLRLQDPQRPDKLLGQSYDVRSAYLSFVSRDCRVSGLFTAQGPTLIDWSNVLYSWNLDLWGCTGHDAASFALVHAEVTELTSADAALLVDGYLQSATETLRLSSPEAGQMRNDLERLAKAAITRASDDHPFSECSDAGDDGNAGADAADVMEAAE